MNEPSYFFALAQIMMAPAYLISLFSYLIWEITEPKNEAGEGTMNPEVLEAWRKTEAVTLAYEMLSYVRRLALAVVVTFGRTSFLA